MYVSVYYVAYKHAVSVSLSVIVIGPTEFSEPRYK